MARNGWPRLRSRVKRPGKADHNFSHDELKCNHEPRQAQPEHRKTN